MHIIIIMLITKVVSTMWVFSKSRLMLTLGLWASLSLFVVELVGVTMIAIVVLVVDIVIRISIVAICCVNDRQLPLQLECDSRMVVTWV